MDFPERFATTHTAIQNEQEFNDAMGTTPKNNPMAYELVSHYLEKYDEHKAVNNHLQRGIWMNEHSPSMANELESSKRKHVYCQDLINNILGDPENSGDIEDQYHAAAKEAWEHSASLGYDKNGSSA